MSMQPPPPDDAAQRASQNLDQVRAWGERRDQAAKDAEQRAKDAETQAIKYRSDAVAAAARSAGLTDEQLGVLTTMNPNIEPDQVASFVTAFGIQGQPQPPQGQPPVGDPAQQQQPNPTSQAPQAGVAQTPQATPPMGIPLPQGAQGQPAPPVSQPPAAPVVAGQGTGVPPTAHTTDDFVGAARRHDVAGLERMAQEVASGARPLQLKHPEAQEA